MIHFKVTDEKLLVCLENVEVFQVSIYKQNLQQIVCDYSKPTGSSFGNLIFESMVRNNILKDSDFNSFKTAWAVLSTEMRK